MLRTPSFKTGMLIACGTMVVLYSAGLGIIFKAVDSIAEEAKAVYGGDHVEALIELVSDETAPFDKRNTAIWALGQIGDRRALPAIRALDTPEYQERPYETSSYIVQEYVDTSIEGIEEPSAKRWIYRFL